jgi:hypothetical protein
MHVPVDVYFSGKILDCFFISEIYRSNGDRDALWTMHFKAVIIC